MDTPPAAIPAPTPAVTPADPNIGQLSETSTVSEKNGLATLETILSKWKEIIGVIACFDFALGYLTLAFHALRNNLGFIPPLQIQCLIIGVAPFIVLIGAAFVIRCWWIIEERAVQWYTSDKHKNYGSRNLAKVSSLGAITLLVAYDTGFDSANLVRPIDTLGWCVFFLIASLMYIEARVDVVRKHEYPAYYFDDLNEEQAKAFRVRLKIIERDYKKTMSYAAIPVRLFAALPLFQIFLAAGLFWVNIAYPLFPQELGGGQPRGAVLAVTRAQMSPEMRHALLPLADQTLPADMSKDPLAVSETVTVDVVYDNSDAMFVRVHGNEIPKSGRRPTVYQIKKASIQGVTWRGFDERK